MNNNRWSITPQAQAEELMLNENDIELYLHLWYEDISIDLLHKVSKCFKNTVNISLVKDAPSNSAIEKAAKELINLPVFTYVENKGTDQYGFYHNFKLNPTNKPWVLYIHDKSADKKKWLDSIVDIFFDKNVKKIKEYMSQENVGMISKGGEYKKLALGQQELLSKYPNIPFEHRDQLVRSIQTVIWTRELQFLLQEICGLTDKQNLNPFFTAGTVFMARNDIVKLAHKCVHSNYFENFYRTDGDVGHALERFYFYVSVCLNYSNQFI